jgi:hypothetical protein
LRKKSDSIKWNLKKLEEVMYDIAIHKKWIIIVVDGKIAANFVSRLYFYERKALIGF